MFLFSNVYGNFLNLFLCRAVSASSSRSSRNHYMTLGITPAASHDDIKKAYFELCKKYHPDKNDGSVESTKMFRIITEAYDVLGNEKSRQVYDKLMGYGKNIRMEKWNVNRRDDYSYEAERVFYERTKPRKTYTGKSWKYDFDAWTRAHYPNVTEEDMKKMRERRRNWKNMDAGEATSPHKPGRHPYYVFYVAVVIFIGCSLFVLPITKFDNIGLSKRYNVYEGKNENVKRCKETDVGKNES